MKVTNYLLGYKDLYIVQDSEMFNFSLDSVLLPNFVTLNKKIEKILVIGCGNAPIPLILSTKTDAKIIGVEIQKDSYDLAKIIRVTPSVNFTDINYVSNNYSMNLFIQFLLTEVILCPPFF